MSERGLQPCHEPYNMQGMPGACCRNQVPQRHSTDSVCSLLDVVLAETLNTWNLMRHAPGMRGSQPYRSFEEERSVSSQVLCHSSCALLGVV